MLNSHSCHSAFSLTLLATASIAVLALTGCNQNNTSEFTWAREGLERNPQLKVISADEATNTIKVRVKISGEVLSLTPGELAAAPIADLVATTAPAEAAATTSPTTEPVAPSAPAIDEPVAAAVAPAPNTASATTSTSVATPAEPPTYTVQREDGRVRVSGPGVSIETAPKSAQANATSTNGDEPIICDGRRFMHIDNRTLSVNGDAITARGGCELHITNSHVTATGTALTVLDATVHVTNSTITGSVGSLTTSSAARVFLRNNQFKGLARRSPDAQLQDQGSNTWK